MKSLTFLAIGLICLTAYRITQIISEHAMYVEVRLVLDLSPLVTTTPGAAKTPPVSTGPSQRKPL